MKAMKHTDYKHSILFQKIKAQNMNDFGVFAINDYSMSENDNIQIRGDFKRGAGTP